MTSRYETLAKIAAGGMATVSVGALKGGHGLRHLVALKQPHQHLLDDPGFTQALLDEAEVASGIRHANVVSVREVEHVDDSIQLVLDYVEGASLGQMLVRAATKETPIAIGVALRIVLDACAGLAALHELTDDAGRPLGFVHRDVSPQNVLVGIDGVARITDFGLAKCAQASDQPTTKGTLKGKLGYMAPEYVRGKSIDARADVFAMGIVAWEALTGRRLFRGENDADTIDRVLRSDVPPPSSHVPQVGAAIDAVIARALARSPDARFATIRDFAAALESAARDRVASPSQVAEAVRAFFGDELAERRRVVRERLATSASTPPPPPAIAADEPTRDRTRPRRRATIAFVVIAIVALGAAIVSGVLWRKRIVEPPLPPPTSSASIAPSAPIAPPPSTASSPSPAIVDAGRAPSPAPPRRRPSPTHGEPTVPRPPPNPY